MRSYTCHQTRSAVDTANKSPSRLYCLSAKWKAPPRRPLPPGPAQLFSRKVQRCLAASDAPDSAPLPAMPAGEREEHEQGQLMEQCLQLAELALLVAAAGPHVVALLAHMGHATRHVRTEATQPRGQVAACLHRLPCRGQADALLRTSHACMPGCHA